MKNRGNQELLSDLKSKLGFSEAFIESIEDGLLIMNAVGQIIMVNNALCECTGFSRAELLNVKAPFPFWPKERHAEFTIGLEKALREGLIGEFESVHVHKEGEHFPVSIFSSNIKDETGAIVAHLGLFRKVEKKKEDLVLEDSPNYAIFSFLNHRKKINEIVVGKELVSQLDFTLSTIVDGIVSVDGDWYITYINGSASNYLGKSPRELIGNNLWELYPDFGQLDFYKIATRAQNTQKKQQSITYFPSLDKWFENKFYPSKEGLTIFFMDITDQKRAEELAMDSQNYLDNIINTISDPIFVKDADSRLLLVNEAFCSMFGLSRPDILGKTLAEEVSPEEREMFLKIDKEVIASGVENINEESLTVRGGKAMVLSTKKTRFVDEKGQPFLIGIIRDVTERKKTELALRSAKEYSEGLIDSMHEGLVIFNLKTEIINVNPSFCRMSGFSREELVGKGCPYPFSPPEIEEESHLRHQKISKGEELENFETVYMCKDGSRFHVDVMISLLHNTQGEVLSYFATIIDTTHRKQAEKELKSAKEFTDKLVMSMQEGLIIVDLEGKIMLVNDSTCNILGYSRSELVGLELPYPFIKMEDFEDIVRTNQRVAAGKAPSFQFEFIRKNGEPFLASFLTGNITNEANEVIALFGTMKDISKEEKARRTLVDIAMKSSQKKDVILKLAGLVGQDFRESLLQISELSARTLAVDRVSVWSFDREGTEIRCEHHYSRSREGNHAVTVLHLQDNPEYFKALETQRVLKVSHAQEDSVTRLFNEQYLVPNKIRSLMDVLVNSGKGRYGIICFEHVGHDFREWTPDEQEFATSIANIVSLMVESNQRKRAEDKLLLANKELSKANKELNALRERLELENIYLRNELDLVFNFEEMVYGSVQFSNVLSEVEKVAETTATVLLLGESGTGKELLARAIHNISARNNKPLIKVNCSAIPRELIESELFGHKKGSFTGAVGDKVGKFELADGGTLFLDEIGELPLDMQPKILRFLQEGEIEVVGGTGIRKLDVRVIAATNRDLKEEIEGKRFREDLYFRLNVFPIVVPPLRDRREDIPLLIEHFLDKFNKEYSKNLKYVSDGAMKKLKAYHWPGNIRELENLIERACILSQGETLVIPGFESELQKSAVSLKAHNSSLKSIERSHILSVLEECQWKITGPNGASTKLDVKPSTLRDKMAKLGIKRRS